ncbi:hypothetical protein [Streptomyces sp. KN37]|uniref:hypothetical protein n=1 Tax=Streptomyces sp. KN37 TaxID=3090667 RepID=UPI002A763CD5|nr:hypothetical protein [Streptomyces sp. KN37]WPO74032.1 hypothetical protein R9806_27135 [Streptomyces sp. KN37]
MLIQHLPPESHTMTALRNELSDEELAEQARKGEPERGRWSQSEQLLALLADRVGALHHMYASTHSTRRQKPPEPIRRPGAKAARGKQEISDEQAATLFQMINGGAA